MVNLDFRIDRYEVSMRRCHDPLLDLRGADGRFVVRHWDGMDGTWSDVSEAPLDAEGALDVWEECTEIGTRNTDFRHLDYYRIFPAGSVMLWSEGREMFAPGDELAVTLPALDVARAADAVDADADDEVAPPSSGWRDR